MVEMPKMPEMPEVPEVPASQEQNPLGFMLDAFFWLLRAS
jgi:hypothetical protein